MAFYKNKVIARNSFGFGLRLCVVVVDVSLKDGAVTVYTNKGVCFSKKELKRLFKKIGLLITALSCSLKSAKSVHKNVKQ